MRKLDRLGRSTKEILTVADNLSDRGIGLWVLTGTLAGTYTPRGEGKFFFTVMAAFAELSATSTMNARWPASRLRASRDGSAGGPQ
jgi:DNA invertase Pin-like site-specific DNA recombinase